MVRLVKTDPRMTAKFANEQMGISIGVYTIRRRLNVTNLLVKRSTATKISNN